MVGFRPQSVSPDRRAHDESIVTHLAGDGRSDPDPQLTGCGRLRREAVRRRSGLAQILTGSDICDIGTAIFGVTLCSAHALSVSELISH
jgi:hypothetical protein